MLGGIISPINGVGPSDLTIRQLVERVSEKTEVILALSGDVEGETTSFYIYRQIESRGCKVTTLARVLGICGGRAIGKKTGRTALIIGGGVLIGIGISLLFRPIS